MLNKKLATSWLALVVLSPACDEDASHSEPCSEGDVFCEGNALAVCKNASWSIEICKNEKPICDVSSKSCIEDENACHPAKCSLPSYAVSMGCNDDDVCIVTRCEDGFGASQDKQSCILCPVCHDVKHASTRPSPVDCACLITCDDGYALSDDGNACQSTLDCTGKIEHGTAKVDDDENICVVDKCDETYAPSDDHKSCVFVQNPCQAMDGNVPVVIRHGEQACDGNDLKTCINGTLSDNNVKKCDDGNAQKVCRYEASGDKFGCYNALTNPACTLENYEQACDLPNVETIEGCRSNGTCVYTCTENTVDTGTQCIAAAHCSTTAASLTNELNTVTATGVASLNDNISKAAVYCTNDLKTIGRRWATISDIPSDSALSDGSRLNLTSTAAILSEGRNYCVMGVVTEDSKYFFCPPGNSPDQLAIYSSNSTMLTESQVLVVDNSCGNGTIDPGEECDSDNFAGKTCATVKQNDKMLGTLSCKLCKIDDSACSEDFLDTGDLIFSFRPNNGCENTITNNEGIAENGCTVDESGKIYTINYIKGYAIEFTSNAKVKSDIALYNKTQSIKLSGLPNGAVLKFEMSSAAEGNELQIVDNGSVPTKTVWTIDTTSGSKVFKMFGIAADASEATLSPTDSGNSKKVLIYEIDVYEPAS